MHALGYQLSGEGGVKSVYGRVAVVTVRARYYFVLRTRTIYGVHVRTYYGKAHGNRCTTRGWKFVVKTTEKMCSRVRANVTSVDNNGSLTYIYFRKLSAAHLWINCHGWTGTDWNFLFLFFTCLAGGTRRECQTSVPSETPRQRDQEFLTYVYANCHGLARSRAQQPTAVYDSIPMWLIISSYTKYVSYRLDHTSPAEERSVQRYVYVLHFYAKRI